ncbi:hypothetical protein BGZ76_009773 [Entomortierella beljakovae]|nr:hypothetical protein BGZ76_009773 [Entomortierella beljakovae]
MSRSLSWISMTGISITASNVLCGVVALYGLPLTNGGPAWVTWGYLIVGVMSCIVSLCLAELAAAYPTAAGVHHWVFQLTSSKQKPFLTWMTGWLAFVGAIASASSIAFYFSSVLGQLLYSLYRIALTPGILVMFHLGAVLIWQLFNLFPVRGLGYISTLGGVTVTATIVLLSHSSVDSSMVHVPFTVFLNYSGSSSAVYATLSSALMASFAFCPQDSIIRMQSEEARRPHYIIPKLVIGSNVVGLILGLPLIIALNYGILQPMKGLLDEAVPAVRVILVTLGKPLGTLFVSLIISGIFFTGLARLSIATRVAYALSRDAGLPKSTYWNHLQSRRKTPQRISWLITVAFLTEQLKMRVELHIGGNCQSHEQGHSTSHTSELRYFVEPSLPPRSLVRKKSANGGSMLFGPESADEYEREPRLSYARSFQARTTTKELRSSYDQSHTWRGISSTDSRSRTYSKDRQPHSSGYRSSRGLWSAKTTTGTSNSNQDRPLSILGVPFTSSPEISHLEPGEVLSPTALTSRKHTELSRNPGSMNYYQVDEDFSSLSSSPILKVSNLGISGSYNSVPEISIAPPTTIGSSDSRTSSRIQSQSQTTMSEVHFSPQTQMQQEASSGAHSNSCPPEKKRVSYSGTLSSLVMRPLNATESIFPELSPTSPSSCSGSRHFTDVNSVDNTDRDIVFNTDCDANDLDEVVNETQISTISHLSRSHIMKRGSNIPPPIVIPTPASSTISNKKLGTIADDAATIENTIKINDLHGDDSFDEEYLHQYPVISAYKSTHDLFNVIPSPTSIAAQELIAVLQHTNGSRSTDYDERSRKAEDANLSPRNTFPSELVGHRGADMHRNNFNDKNHVVARWAREQAKIQKWRLEKMGALELHDHRKHHSLSGDAKNCNGENLTATQNPSSLNNNWHEAPSENIEISANDNESLDN